MIEKFIDYESTRTTWISKEGEYLFTITDAVLGQSKSGGDKVTFTCVSDAGQAMVDLSLSKPARWRYNQLISACLRLTEEDKKTYQLDYDIIHQQLVNKKFIGVVTARTWTKESKVLQEDGTFEDVSEEKISYSITDYKPAP